MDFLCNVLRNTVFLTVVSGVFVFVVGQIFMEYVLKPRRRYQELRARAAYHLTFYANRYNLEKEESKPTSEELRKFAAELDAFSVSAPRIIFLKKTRLTLRRAAVKFVNLSNSVNSNPNGEKIKVFREEAAELLKLYQHTNLKA